MFSIKKINQIYPGKRADSFLENARLGTAFFSGTNNKFRLGKDIFFIGLPPIFTISQTISRKIVESINHPYF